MPLPKKIPRGGSSSKGSNSKAAEKKRVLANRYQVERKLGSGNFGTAWLVTDLKTKDEKDKMKVLKEIPVGDLQPDETVDAMHEAKLLRNLDHPGIVKFYDSFIDGEFFCIVTEFCEGGDLDEKIVDCKKKSKCFPEPQVVEWIIELMLAVQYMHDRRVMHRDLKTRNIFLRNNRVKVGDFGISRILMGSSDMASTFVGTPYYMSPEVLKHEGYNAKSDVWSIGCVLYDLCVLEHAFEGQSLMGVMYKITEGDLPDWPKQYSKDLQAVFERILEKDPARRPSASECLKLPFIAKQVELLKNTMMEKHAAKGNRDSINKEAQQLRTELKQHSRLEEIRKESEDKKWRNLSPRERMRLRKQQKADEEAERLQRAARQQLKDNRESYEKIKHNNNPYDTHINPLWAGGKAKGEERKKSQFPDQALSSRPYTAPVHQLQEESSSEDEDSGEEFQTAKEFHTAPQNFSKSLGAAPRDADLRPITPMKDTMVYDMEHSSLDWAGGVPDKDDLANTYYSQFEEEFENGASGSDEEKTLVGDEKEIEDLISYMEYALDKDDTINNQTLADDTLTGAFGPGTKEIRLKNLRSEAEKKLGREVFQKVYAYLKEARGFGGKGARVTDEQQIMKELSRLTRNTHDCFLVDQLLFLDAESSAAS